MKYNEINDRDLLLKEYDFKNKMIENKNKLFNKIVFLIAGTIGSLGLFFQDKIQKIFVNQIFKDEIFLVFIGIFTVGIILVVADLISEMLIKKDKKKICSQIETLKKRASQGG